MNGLAMLGIWTAAGVVIGTIAGWAPLQTWLETHDKLAAWVQAVGSIAAILGAAWIAYWQASASKRDFIARRIEHEREKARSIKSLLRRAKLIVDNANRAIAVDEGARRLAAEQVRFIQAALRGLPIFEIPSADLVFQLQRVDRDLFYVLAVLDRTEERLALGRPMKVGRLMGRINKRTAEAVATCEELIGSRK